MVNIATMHNVVARVMSSAKYAARAVHCRMSTEHTTASRSHVLTRHVETWDCLLSRTKQHCRYHSMVALAQPHQVLRKHGSQIQTTWFR